MKVKGTSLKTTREFVKYRFPKDYNKWLSNLKPESKLFYESFIDVADWYPIQTAYLDPINKIAELFYNRNYAKCGEEMGEYSAEIALKGIYKVFIMIAKPNFLVKRASKIIETYYRPSEVSVTELGTKSAYIDIITFPEMTLALEYRFAGWCRKALEFTNCMNIRYSIESFISKGDPSTKITFMWE
ncbi:hypothetical protein ACFLTE_07600 [Bacteroidota bacterium]